MKKEKGFTLIELLAVIVILAVVALVATPIVLNVINSSREKARLSSAYGVVDAARLDYIQKKYEDAIIPTTNVLDSLTIGGEKPTGDVRINENGEIAIALIYDGTRCYKKGYDDSDITKTTIEVGGECIIDGIPSEEPIVPWPTYSESIQNLIDGAVTSGDGLYLETTDGTYRYKGGNPSNYIRLFAGNDGIFRIISINNQGMKVVSAQGAVYNEWDAKDNHDVSGSENTYCTDEINNGCNAWSSVLGIYSNRDLTGTVSTNSSILTYLEDVYYVNNLNEISSKIIENATWNIGGIAWAYDKTLQTLLGEEDDNTWIGKIGLINPSDFIMAQLPGNDSDNCYNDTLNNTYCTESDTNWLNSSFWTMNPEYDTFTAYSLNGVGYVDHMEVHCTSNVGPVVYLKPDIVLGGESGVDAEHAMTILP